MNKLFDVGVVGATGLVGRKILEVLEKRNFPINKLHLFASEKSEGSIVSFKGKDYKVLTLNGENVIKNRVDIAFFSIKSEISKRFAPLFSALGATVIDNSSAFRMEEHIPLIVPKVNGDKILGADGIISNPNCSTIIAVSALYPLHKKYGIKRIIYNTYQAVSGAGNGGLNDLLNDTQITFEHKIKNNIIAKIGQKLSNGYTEEEQKMMDETKKILGDYDMAVTATAVRVPVLYSHSISVNVELNCSVSINDITNSLSEFGISLLDVPTPLLAQDSDDVFVGRIRRDYSHSNTFNMFIVSDNLLKGAALNAVEIGEYFIGTKF